MYVKQTRVLHELSINCEYVPYKIVETLNRIIETVTAGEVFHRDNLLLEDLSQKGEGYEPVD